MCGEHPARSIASFHCLGSSPRVRGTLGKARIIGDMGGIIPARAGNTTEWTPCRCRTWDHPRVCGEHGTGSEGFAGIPGSSPRARGTRPDRVPSARGLRIIPACAGNTNTVHTIIGGNWDHPRVRGEHAQRLPSESTPMGSSPRARGTRCGQDFRHREPGIIPACAGNTIGRSNCVMHPKDHPRVRGEHLIPWSLLLEEIGSSPRARGTPQPNSCRLMLRGIIPACAGNTWLMSTIFSVIRDHPRVRGEHCDRCAALGSGLGSSPRARGTLLAPRYRAAFFGIIPACAGNTALGYPHDGPGRDHPRVRGEHLSDPYTQSSHPGSSPRARGTQCRR